MPYSVECPCGRVIPTATPSLPPGAVCPRCGRDPLDVALQPRRKTSLTSLVAAVAGTAVLTVGAVGLAVVKINSHVRAAAPAPVAVAAPDAPRLSDPPPAAQVLPEPPPKPAAPTPVEPAPPKAQTPPRPVVPEGRLEPDRTNPARFAVGTVFEQDVLISRRAAYRVLGIETVQEAKYGLTSKLAVAATAKDGGFTVTQTVTGTKLHAASEGFRPLLATALRKCEGATFEIAVTAAGDIAGFTAPKDAVKVADGTTPEGGPTLRVWSVLDADAWRELATLTFLDPSGAAVNDTWARPLRHDWGHFGAWSGQTLFAAKGKQTGLDRVDFRHDLKYLPPPEGADTALPARIVKPQFRLERAGGAVLFDPKRKRTAAIDEVFRVRGSATVAFAGQLVGVEMDELQRFETVIRDPAAREMSGKPGR